MNQVKVRVITPASTRNGTYYVTDPSVLNDLECAHHGLRALEQAIYASGLMVSPFDVAEAVVSCNGATYRYEGSVK